MFFNFFNKKRRRGLEMRNAVIGLLFISPFLLGFVFFMAVPLVTSLRMSFSRVGFGHEGFILTPNGFANYNWAITVDPDFNRQLVEELQKIGTQVPFIVVLSFFVALLLNQKFKFRGLARSVFFLPVILSSGVILGIESNNSLLSDMRDVINEYSDLGRITDVLEQLFLGGMTNYAPVQFVLNAVNGIYDVMMASGIQILIFLAGLQSVPASMYEAAKIEGATAWESFWKITLPMVSSLILVCVVYSIIDTCVKSNSALFSKIRNIMIGRMDYGVSSAMSWMYFLSILAIVLVVTGVLSRVVFYDE